MKKLKNISVEVLFVMVFLLLTHISVFAQIKKPITTKKPNESKAIIDVVKPSERPVKVLLKEGEPISGKFSNASSEGIQIVIAGNTLTLKWDVISQIIFTDIVSNSTVAMTGSQSVSDNEAVQSTLRSLRKLAAATEVGVNFQDYGRRLIDVKAEVSEFIVRIPDGFVKDEINLSMDAYADAGTAWNEMLRYDFMLADYEPGKSLQQKYSIPVDRSLSSAAMNREAVLSTIWATARRHIENAANGKKPEKPELSEKLAANESVINDIKTLTGKWDVVIDGGNMTINAVLDLTQTNSEVKGKIIFQQGAVSITSGSTENDSFTLNITNPVFMVIKGKRDGGKISGSFEAPQGKTTFTGNLIP